MQVIKCEKCNIKIAEVDCAGTIHEEEDYIKCSKCGKELCVDCFARHECEGRI